MEIWLPCLVFVYAPYSETLPKTYIIIDLSTIPISTTFKTILSSLQFQIETTVSYKQFTNKSEICPRPRKKNNI